MSLRLVRFIPAALLSVTWIAGCEGCGEEGGGGGAADGIIFRYPNGNGVQADGTTRLPFVLIASKASGDPELATITVTRLEGSGRLAIAEGAPTTDSVTGDPNDDGELALEAICDSEGQMRIEADNGKVKQTGTVRCLPLVGDIVVTLNTDDCDELVASGEDTCVVTVAAQQLASTPVPISGPIQVAVTGVEVLSGGPDPNDAVLQVDDVTTTASPSIQISLAADGTGSFVVRSPELNLVENVTVTVSATSGSAVGQATTIIAIKAFNNQATVAFVGTDEAVIGGEDLVVNVLATDPYGEPAAGVDVVFSANDPDQALVFPAVGTVTTLPDGTASITIPTALVTETAIAVINAQFTILGSVTVSASLSVTINIEGALLLNASVDPSTIRSDEPLLDTTTLTIDLEQDNGPVAGGTLNVAISPGQTSRILLVDEANGGVLVPALTFLTGAATTFSVPVTVAVAGVAPGSASVDIEAVDALGVSQTTQVGVQVDRLPILQSIVFVSSTPPAIAVRGSAFPTTTRVEFSVFDDLGNPMRDVPATFVPSGTADPGITLTGTAISDASGNVATILSSGTVAGPVTVVVTATDPRTGDTLTVESAPITITAGLPSAARSKLICGEGTAEAYEVPFTVACTVELVDRNSNTSPDGVGVQFAAEGGSITPFATSGGGLANATFATGEQFAGGTDVFAWSYGALLPDFGDVTDPGGDLDGCFDGTSTTPCDLLRMCELDPDTADPVTSGLYCALPPECLAAGATARATALNPPSEVDAIITAGGRAEIAAYRRDHRVCGFPVSCFTGADISYVGGDECPVSPGCLDFSGTTICPQDGLLTINARTRGEETFNDDNGNGLYDFDDVDGDGRQDLGEPPLTDAQGRPFDTFIDLPEPFVNHNDNCVRDELTESLRLTPAEQLTSTDLFFDVDGNDLYGFDVGGNVLEHNGLWDRDTEVFLQEHVLALFGREVVIGAACDPTTAVVDCGAIQGFNNGFAACVETASGQGIATCQPSSNLPEGGSVSLAFWWTDAFGNCPVEQFVGQATATGTGPIEIAGAETVEFSATNCGFSKSVSPLRPYCESLRNLGSDVYTLNVIANCEDNTEPEAAKVEFALSDTKQSVAFNVLCAP